MKRMKWAVIGAFLMVAMCARATWSDVTATYITNPNFSSGNANGWWTPGGYTVRAGCIEWWNNSAFRLEQELIGLPAGHYRLSVSGYHRLGGEWAAWNTYRETGESARAKLFVDDEEKLIANYFERDFERTSTSSWCQVDGKYYPNTMETAREAFDQGAYVTSIEFDSDGSRVFIGIEYNYKFYDYNNYVAENWGIFSDFKLETTAEIVIAKSLSLNKQTVSVVVGGSEQLQATVLPSNTSEKRVEWSSENPRVATVDQNGVVTGKGIGTTRIWCHTVDTSDLWASADVEVSINSQDEWKDVTSIFVKNAYYDGNVRDGWTCNVSASGNDVNYEGMEVYNGTFDIFQTLTGLPSGRYRVSVQGYYRAGNNLNWNSNSLNLDDYDVAPDNYSGAFVDYYKGEENLTAYLYGGDSQTPIASVFAEDMPEFVNGSFYTYRSQWVESLQNYEYSYKFYPNNMAGGSYAFSEGMYQNSVEFDAAGEAKIGIANPNYVNGNWCMFDNWKLEYKGSVVLVNSLSLSIPNNEIIVGESVAVSVSIGPANALNKKLSWSSSDETVATVSENGVVKGIAEGTAVITAKTLDGSKLSKKITIAVVSREASGSSFVINEIMASNVDEFVSPAYNFDGWMELYNKTASSVSLTGFYLSDDPTDLKKWRIPASVGVLPANGYKVIWFDSNDIAPQNATFKLNVDGGTIYISDGRGNLLMSQTYPAAVERASYARTSDGAVTWNHCSPATPEASNASASFASQQAVDPVVNQPSQLFTTPMAVSVTIPSGHTLRYTTDGTLPTLTNGTVSTNGQFYVSSTSTYRFRLFASGKLPSRVISRSYIYKDRDYYLPVVSVVTDPDFLYSKEIGVFSKGPHGRPGNGQADNCNWNMNWERPVNFSYLDAEGEMVFNQDANLEMCGGWSRAFSPRSFKLKGSKEMGGDKNLAYPFFSAKPYIRNRTLQIRNGGNDNGCRFKDASLQQVVQRSGIDVDCQSYQPIHEFINGEYMGVLNMREPNNKHYVYANYGWDDDMIDQFEMSPDSGYVQKCGTPEAFDELVDVLSPSAGNSETYAEICRRLDIDEFINYMAVELYLGSDDWPRNNLKAFRNRDNGKFRFMLFDIDFAFNSSDAINAFMNKETWTFDELYPRGTGRITAQIKVVTLFKNLLQNADFRRRFVDAFSLMGGSVFEASRSQQILDEMYNYVEPAMNLNGESSKSTYNTVRSRLTNWLPTATGALKRYSTFGLQQTDAQRVVLKSDAEGAQLMINKETVPTGYFDGNLFAPVKLKAVAPAGYAFQGWLKSGATDNVLMPENTVWSYYDQGSLDGQNWMSPTYNVSGWSKGNAPLGYGKDYIATTISYGSDANQKRPTAYFRTVVSLAQEPKATDEFTLSYSIDDGAIIYVNGQEAARHNLSASSVSYSNYADHYAYDNPDQGTLTLAASLFHKGDNVIAVELHNCDNHSTDMVWSAALSTPANLGPTDYYSTESEITLPAGTNYSLTASYRPLTQAERNQQGICPVRINEVSGSNDNYVDEYGKKGDWIELYNTTDEPVDVEGMFLTDNLQKPEKYMITKGNTQAQTVIPAHGHLIIWCDNKRATTSQGLHASFKIAGEGGALQLMAADRSWTDLFFYDAHDANTTYGRYPDGAADIYAMNVVTIGKANIMSSYAQLSDQEALREAYGQSGVERVIASSANGLRLHYGGQQLLVKSEDAEQVVVDLFTTDGRLVERIPVTLSRGTALVSVAHLPSGFYVARATDEDGTRVGCKFVK